MEPEKWELKAWEAYVKIDRNRSRNAVFCGGCSQRIAVGELCFEARTLYKTGMNKNALLCYERGNLPNYYHPSCFAPAHAKEWQRRESEPPIKPLQ